MKFKHVKLISALTVFAVSLITYLLTLEPANSFWDCSEFITCANGLEVGHAPGAPVFMLLGKLFSLFAKDQAHVAIMINGLSGLASALTILILFYTIFWFAEKLFLRKSEELTNRKKILIIIAAVVGSLSYAFSDSFWFSAVEAEVYGTSSLFTALVFWLVLKYSDAQPGKSSYRWLLLIFFILGLSVGIHLLNLLTLPAMALVVYYKHYRPEAKGVWITIILSGLLLVSFIYIIIPGVVKLTAFTDRIFVNDFGLPVYSGALVFIVLLSLMLYFGFTYFGKKKRIIVQVVILAFTFWLLGYSSFTVLVIRSAQNPFVDINNVENIYGLVDYLNREQYPSRPLIYGNNYNSPIVGVKNRYTYKLYDGKYVKDELNPKYIFDSKTLTFFPRMASLDESHVRAYKQWVNIKGRPVRVTNREGKQETIYVPTFMENLEFFFKYQLGYMYGRYLMWNFVGKQNDIQGRGDNLDGNWISGIPFIDNARLGDQSKIPTYYKNLSSRNKYYFIPLLLALIGIWYQYKHDKNNFWVSTTLFFFTGIAIVLYLNEVPITPRERDYVHVGSFYVFALWIGLGALGILTLLDERLSQISGKIKNTRQNFSPGVLIYLIGLGLIVIGPINMGFQDWNDHDRSNRYVANECGKDILKSCEQNAILFTTADNDTYPIWYLQEVEHYRPDIRNVLLAFLPVDWYADQLHNSYGDKGKVNVSFKGKELLMSGNQYFPVVNRIDSFMEAGQVIDFIKSNDERTKIRTSDNELVSFIPGTKLELEVNAENFRKTCSWLKDSSIEIPSSIKFYIKKKYLGRDDMLLLDIITHNNWKRPLYFVYPQLLDNIGLGDYLYREGMVYRLLPFNHQQMAQFAKAKSEYEYNLLTRDFTWGNIDKNYVNLDFTNVQMVGMFRIRQVFVETANLLTAVGEKDKAIELLDKVQALLPPERVPYSWFAPEIIKAYQKAGSDKKAKAMAQKVQHEMDERYDYLQTQPEKGRNSMLGEETLYIMQQLVNIK